MFFLALLKWLHLATLLKEKVIVCLFYICFLMVGLGMYILSFLIQICIYTYMHVYIIIYNLDLRDDGITAGLDISLATAIA